MGIFNVSEHWLRGLDGRYTKYRRYRCTRAVDPNRLLDSKPRDASAVAQVDSVLYSLQRNDFQLVLTANPHVEFQLLALLIRRLRHTTSLAEELAFLDVPARVAVLLLHLAIDFGVEDGRCDALLNIFQAELATYVTASQRSVNRALGDLSRQGLIEVQPKGDYLHHRCARITAACHRVTTGVRDRQKPQSFEILRQARARPEELCHYRPRLPKSANRRILQQ